MRLTLFVLALVSLAISCSTARQPAAVNKSSALARAGPTASPASQPAAPVVRAIDAPAVQPTTGVAVSASAPLIARTTGVAEPASAPAIPAAAVDAPATTPVARPIIDPSAPAPLVKVDAGADNAPVSALINPTAGVNPPADAEVELPANATIDQTLDALDHRGETMREFTAKVSDTTGDIYVDGLSTKTGQMWLQKKGANDARLRVMFDKRVANKVMRVEKTEFLLDNGWLIDRDYRKKSETKRQVARPGEKLNLLKLGEGPFPLPLGQKKEDVKKLFDVTQIPVTKEDGADLADTIHIKLTPKEKTQFARRFGSIDIWVSRKNSFPVRIDTVAPDGSTPHSTRLEDVKINPEPGLKEGDFELPKIDGDAWSLHTEPYRE